MTEVVLVRMSTTDAEVERLAELLPRVPKDVEQRLVDQLWLRMVMIEQRKRMRLAERAAYDARCDRILALLDPAEDGPSREALTVVVVALMEAMTGPQITDVVEQLEGLPVAVQIGRLLRAMREEAAKR